MTTFPPHHRLRSRLRVAPPDRREAETRRRLGSNLVELTLATPFLLLLMLGTIDLGRMLHDYIQLRGAAVEGASFGIRNPNDTGQIEDMAEATGVPAGTLVTVNRPPACLTIGGVANLTVTATSTFTPVTTNFLDQFWNIGSVNLAASSTMRCLT